MHHRTVGDFYLAGAVKVLVPLKFHLIFFSFVPPMTGVVWSAQLLEGFEPNYDDCLLLPLFSVHSS